MPITVKTSKGSLGTGKVVVRDSSTGSLALNGAPGANAVGETVDSMTISEVAWSVSAGGSWTLARGANTVFICSAGQGQVKFDDSQLKLEQNRSEEIADLSYTLSGTGTIVVRVTKKSGA